MAVLQEFFATLAETTTTADPGAAGVALAVTTRTPFPAAGGQFRVLVQNSEADKTNREIMIVTAGSGAGAGSFTVTRGVEGTTAVAHPVGSYVAAVLTADAQKRWTPDYTYQPRHSKHVLSSGDPVAYATVARTPVTLVPYVVKVYVPETITVASLTAYLIGAGATLVAGSNRMGIYTVSGTTATLASQTATITWTANAVNTVALAASQVITGGPGVFVYVAILCAATTLPTFAGSPALSAALQNAGLVAADGYRGGKLAAVVSGSGLPATFDYTTGITQDVIIPWMAGS